MTEEEAAEMLMSPHLRDEDRDGGVLPPSLPTPRLASPSSSIGFASVLVRLGLCVQDASGGGTRPLWTIRLGKRAQPRVTT